MIKKYDRFEWGDEIIEYTGFSPFINDGQSCLFVGINSGGEAKARFFTEEELESSEFKKLPPPLNHPAVLEAVRLTRDKPEIRAQYAKALAIQFTASNHAQKREIAELLKLHLPEELRNALVCGEPCGQCRECAKRIEG